MRYLTIAAALLCCLCVSAAWAENAKDADSSKSPFARGVIDLGVVVSDIDKAAAFYTKAIGFEEQEGFGVSGEFCKQAGLTDGKPLKIRVFTLQNGDNATRLKLMQLPGVKSKKSDNEYIHSELGVSYITIFVNDTNAAVARLKKAKVAPLAKGPVELPEGLPQGVFLTVVRDPDGNLIELVGPKK